jgi:NADH dehydrogenase
MTGLDRARREVQVAPVLDDEGTPITPPYTRGYDTLVLATGSHTNDFGTPGVHEHAIALETPEEAERFHVRMVNACIRAHVQGAAAGPHQVTVAIVGAGATGVELAAELRKALRLLVTYGLDQIDPERDIQIHLIEAGPRILPALPERIANAAAELLKGLGIQLRCGTKVSAVRADGVELAGGVFVPAHLVVWAAGVKAPRWLRELDGLETNSLNQLVVRPTLQTTRDDAVFSIGDCAAAPWLGHTGNAARAQAAHQQASQLAAQLPRLLKGQPLKPFSVPGFRFNSYRWASIRRSAT